MNIILTANKNTCRQIIIFSIVIFLNNQTRIITMLSFLTGIYGFLMLYKNLKINQLNEINQKIAACIILDHIINESNINNNDQQIITKTKHFFDYYQKIDMCEKYGSINFTGFPTTNKKVSDYVDTYYTIIPLLHIMNYLISANYYIEEEDLNIYIDLITIIEKIYQQKNNLEYVIKMLEILNNKVSEINVNDYKNKYNNKIFDIIDKFNLESNKN